MANWYESFDQSKMTVCVSLFDDDEEEFETELPFKFEVCHRCNGRGSHVDPNVDGNGLSSEDIYDDPDFAEGYFGGRYDVSCYECHGRRVVVEIDEEKVKSEEQKKNYELLKQRWHDDAVYAAEQAAERRMGY